MYKKIIILIIAILSYLLYARFVLVIKPYDSFSLIDDGEKIQWGIQLRECLKNKNCNSLKEGLVKNESGRSRTTYILFEGILFQPPLVTPQFQHSFRIYLMGLLMIIPFVLITLEYRAKMFPLLVGLAIFVTNYSFSENMIRLGTSEPYQVILLAWFSLLYIKFNQVKNIYRNLYVILMVLLITIFFSFRESSIAILPAILLLEVLLSNNGNLKKMIIIFALPTIVYVVQKRLLAGNYGMGAVYVSNYNINLKYIFENSKNYILTLSVLAFPFLELSILVSVTFLIFKKTRKIILSKEILYWAFLTFCYAAIYFPWKYTLDRYLMISIFCLAVFVSLLLNKVIAFVSEAPLLRKYSFVFHGILFLIISNIFFIGFPKNIVKTINYRDWFVVFTQFESEQVKAISKYANSKVYINLADKMDNWEVIQEIPMHLRFFYDGKPKTERLIEPLPSNGYIFSRNSLVNVINFGDSQLLRYQLLESKNYSVSQIDLLAFEKLFKYRPLQALINPPLMKDSQSYYWEIRKLK